VIPRTAENHRPRSPQDDRRVPARHRDSTTPVLRQHGCGTAAGGGPRQQQPPGKQRGNLDNRELVAGSTLYIPVFVRGALFEVGMARCAGDGEVGSPRSKHRSAAVLRLTVRRNETHVAARGDIDRYISMGMDPDLTGATQVAIQEMIDFLVAEKHSHRHQSYQLVKPGWQCRGDTAGRQAESTACTCDCRRSIFRR